MTTLVAVRKNDEIAIAADSLTTFGDTRLSSQYDRTPEKIVRYKDTYIGLCGSAAHQLVFESLLAKHNELDFYSKGGIFDVYSMREVFEYTKFWAAGSGREFALGAMYAQYPRLKSAAAIAQAGVEAGATFDKNSGLPMTLYTVTATG